MKELKTAEDFKSLHQFATDFAKLIVYQEWHGAYLMLAPWIRKEISPDDLRLVFEKELWEMNREWKIYELIYPADFEISYNHCSLSDLKEKSDWREPRLISKELNENNFRLWMVIKFLTDENDERTEFDAWFDFWLIISESNAEFNIGYFEFTEPD
ncbi:MAG: hypothetical protein K1X72_29130 [Pyrinomonadaceae bacterium]|nr:hypothetical protein [Pyrinomonadaceae bacterium]